MPPFTYAKIESDTGGASRLVDVDVDFGGARIAVGEQSRRTSRPLGAGQVLFTEVTQEEAPPDWHAAPFCFLGVILAGAIDVETGDGTVRRFGPGDVCMATDVQGCGHRTSVVEAPLRMLVVSIADGSDESR